MTMNPSVSTHYRWLVLLAAWSAFLATLVCRLAWASVALPVSQSLGLTLAALGGVVSAFYAGYVASNALSGFFVDRFGARRMLGVTLVPLGLLTLCFGSVRTLPQAVALQILMGFAAGVGYAACIKLISCWFGPRERGRATGLFMTAASAAVMLTNLLVPTLLPRLQWNGVYQVLGTATTALGLLVFVVLRDAPDGAAPAGPRGAAALRHLLRNRELLLLGLAGVGAMWGTWGTAFWANALLVRAHGYSLSRAGFVVGLFGAGALVAKPLIGLVSDLLGGRRKLPAVVGLLAFAVMLLVYGSLDNDLALLVVAPLLGLCAFSNAPLLPALVVELAGVELAGAATGLSNATWQLGTLTAPLAVGAAFRLSESFLVAFATLAVGPLLAAALLLFVRESRTR